ncbi:MAG: DUF1963 domain-containing protein, partial [Bacteroidetes bacterium]
DRLFAWIKTTLSRGKEVRIGYALEGNPRTEAEVEQLCQAFGLGHRYAAIRPRLRPRIDLELQAGAAAPGRSQLGGAPDLPPEVAWPLSDTGTPLAFLAQINLAEAAPHAPAGLLPATGILAFFYDAEAQPWGFDPEDQHRFRVLYLPDTKSLQRPAFPEALPEEARFSPHTLQFSASLSLPPWDHPAAEGLASSQESNAYDEVSSGEDNQMLGYANSIQNPMEQECHELYPQLWGLEAGLPPFDPEDWVLLLQLDSDFEQTGMMWGDMGRLYFWIHKQDLAARAFARAWCILQCT